MKSRPARCPMLSTLPVSRVSTPTTVPPRSSSVSDRGDRRKPAAPVITALGMLDVGRWWLQAARWLDGVPVEPAHEREPHDLQVERDRPVLDVIQVVLDALLERGVAAPAVHLRPARDSGLHLVAQHVLRDAVFELLDEVRAL